MSGWALFRQSLKSYRDNWLFLSLLVLIVAVPVAILSSTLVDPAADSSLSAYLVLAQLIMNAAVIYAVTRLSAGKKVNLRQAYYEGTGVFVRLVLTSALLMLMSLLVVLGFVVLLFGLLAPGTTLSLPEKLLVLLLAILPLLPGLWIMARSVWAVLILFDTKLGPLQAVSQSWRLTKNKSWRTLGRLLLLLLFLIGLSVVPTLLFVALTTFTHIGLFTAVMQMLLSAVIIPVAGFYLWGYYQELKR